MGFWGLEEGSRRCWPLLRWDEGGIPAAGFQVARPFFHRRVPSARRAVPGALEAGLWCQEEAITPHLSFPTMPLFHHLLGFFPLYFNLCNSCLVLAPF